MDNEAEDYFNELDIDDEDEIKNDIVINIEDYYTVLKILGSGAYGTVYQVKSHKDNQIYALKMMNEKLEQVVLKDIEREYEVLKILGDKCKQGLVCYHKLFKGRYKGTNLIGTHTYICLLMDYIQGFELFDYVNDECITKNKWLNEDQMFTVMKHLAYTVKLLHDNNIVHRDIKAKNIIINGTQMVLIDYGFLCSVKNINIPDIDLGCFDNKGTPLYLSPELYQIIFSGQKIQIPGKVLKAADVWALGVVFYLIITCEFPFRGFDPSNDGIKQFYNFLRKGDLQKSQYNFINGMLETDFKKRLTINDVYKILDR